MRRAKKQRLTFPLPSGHDSRHIRYHCHLSALHLEILCPGRAKAVGRTRDNVPVGVPCAVAGFNHGRSGVSFVLLER